MELVLACARSRPVVIPLFLEVRLHGLLQPTCCRRRSGVLPVKSTKGPRLKYLKRQRGQQWFERQVPNIQTNLSTMKLLRLLYLGERDDHPIKPQAQEPTSRTLP